MGGISCGILLFIASSLQQLGIQYTTVGKAGFITAMYIVLVPMLGIFLKKKVDGKVWGGVIIAVVGLYMLCVTDRAFLLQKGDPRTDSFMKRNVRMCADVCGNFVGAVAGEKVKNDVAVE